MMLTWRVSEPVAATVLSSAKITCAPMPLKLSAFKLYKDKDKIRTPVPVQGRTMILERSSEVLLAPPSQCRETGGNESKSKRQELEHSCCSPCTV